MAFADDLLLFNDDDANLPLMLQDAEAFFNKRGMSSNAYKSSCILMVHNVNALKYRGHHFNATGVLKPSLGQLPIWLQRLSNAPLKPGQKIIGAREIWPRCNTPTTQLLEIDPGLRASLVQATLKARCSTHEQFMRAIWKYRR